MSQISFYILSQASTTHRHRFACRLVEKAYSQGKRVYVVAADAREAALLDDLLWTYNDGAFLPHLPARDAADDTPIHIGAPQDRPVPADVLLNLSVNTPAYFSEYERVAEVIDQEPTRLSEGRARFRAYREAGIEPETHTLK
ncbi:MAG: DNA polymerase III subunit chi [Gammaproteobacteria bacterium]|nr:DNA polymerase III subunit chi [Gammaproteobacteria bacterium]MCP5136958.1 DNA polymerase III subunit chi [Gammaproteobacteria bacterium]